MFCMQLQSVVWDVWVAERFAKTTMNHGRTIPRCVLAILCMLLWNVVILPTFGDSIFHGAHHYFIRHLCAPACIR